jgi:hypothetical protein
MKLKLIPLADLTFDKRFYPRVNTDWVTITRYANAQKAGAKFPPITACKWNGKWVVIDGWHRGGVFLVEQREGKQLTFNDMRAVMMWLRRNNYKLKEVSIL